MPASRLARAMRAVAPPCFPSSPGALAPSLLALSFFALVASACSCRRGRPAAHRTRRRSALRRCRAPRVGRRERAPTRRHCPATHHHAAHHRCGSRSPCCWLGVRGARRWRGVHRSDQRGESLRRRGIGTLLLQHIIAEARLCGERSVVLNTQRDVPWNGPWYERHRFAVVPRGSWSPALEAHIGRRRVRLRDSAASERSLLGQ